MGRKVETRVSQKPLEISEPLLFCNGKQRLRALFKRRMCNSQDIDSNKGQDKMTSNKMEGLFLPCGKVQPSREGIGQLGPHSFSLQYRLLLPFSTWSELAQHVLTLSVLCVCPLCPSVLTQKTSVLGPLLPAGSPVPSGPPSDKERFKSLSSGAVPDSRHKKLQKEQI